MQQFYCVKEVLNERLKRGYEFAVKNEYIEEKVTEKLQGIAATARMDGFRKGKVSPEFVRRMYGDSIASEVVAQVVDDISSKFLKEGNFAGIVTSDVDIKSYPKVCSGSENGGDLVYELKFEVMPEVPVVDIDGITLKEIEVNISQEDVDEFLEDLKANYPSFVDVDESRGAADGDRVTISYRSAFKGKALRGGSAQGFTFVLGKGQLLEKFEEQIVGMKKGESKEFKLEFPVDYMAKHFAGKEVDMHVTVEKLSMKDEISDKETLASKCGFGSVEDMVKFATDGLNRRFADMGSVVAQRELLEHLDASYSVDVPEYIVAQELGRMRRELREGDPSDEETLTKEAERRVKLGMLLMKVATDAGVAVEVNDILSFIRVNYSAYGRSMEDVLKLFKNREDFREHVKGKVLEDKVVRYIISRAKKDKQSMSAGELKSLFESV
ncbi:trigger factor [Anaplasma phagocytophilum str. Norway variant1]|uniref:Trigger factor n=1 Tax=Anaplasma phagocytophilum str. Norway variant1 TaxID=1392506 RepID=A0A7H9E0H2_ANAPH|nr:trigger factor [Anaplasma phagocytophilum]QLL66929.1 trigger factor [Anaplasma phagocytophilum str. Norway variant1]